MPAGAAVPTLDLPPSGSLPTLEPASARAGSPNGRYLLQGFPVGPPFGSCAHLPSARTASDHIPSRTLRLCFLSVPLRYRDPGNWAGGACRRAEPPRSGGPAPSEVGGVAGFAACGRPCDQVGDPDTRTITLPILRPDSTYS